ncbi:MAG: 50S ribosomal protein L5 [Candidatus Marinimicrobia bacterium]|nr:50S ribosomal protein L5 [Candidatus Neomarinimicrobiota bacterium]
MTEEKKTTKKPVAKATKKVTEKAVKKPVAKATKKVAEKAVEKNVNYVPNYKKLYLETIVPNLMKRFGYSSIAQVPKIIKFNLNYGFGDAKTNSKGFETALQELNLISGQKAIVTKSKKDISNFKIRKGVPVGCTVTIRGKRMYEFFERLNSIALPRTRDFNGLSFKSFDKRGNYNFGIKEQIVFTEIDYDKIDAIRGMNISIATTAKTDDEAYWLLKEFGFPLREKPIKKVEEAEAA